MTSPYETCSKKEKKECPICVENRTKNVVCPYCEFSACVECYKRVCIESINKPCCMECKKTFSDDFFMSVVPKTWYNGDYKKKLENDLLSFEKALLPETQPHIERLKRREEIKAEMDEYRSMINSLKQKIIDLSFQYRDLDDNPDESKSEKKEVFIGACPVQDCRGFLSSHYKCGICSIKACSSCREVKTDDTHVCNPDTVATVMELKKTCRNCPNCMTAIHRISGCPQMWCTKCHVAFNWDTGKIEKGIIHNPHYFDYMRKNGGEIPRNPHEERCGGLPNFLRLVNDPRLRVPIPVLKRFGTSYKNSVDYISNLYREVNHIRQVELPRLPTRMDNINNLDIRIEYLSGKITEEEMKIKLFRIQKSRNKKLDERDILDMYCNVIQDLFVKLSDDFKVIEFLKNEEQLSKYVHESYKTLNKKYGSSISSLFKLDYDM